MRATKFGNCSENTGSLKRNQVEYKAENNSKSNKAIKLFSFTVALTLAATALIVPTTTLAPNVDAFGDSKTAAYSIGDVDAFSSLIKENCISVTKTNDCGNKKTDKETKTTEKSNTKKSEKAKSESEKDKKAKKPSKVKNKTTDKSDSKKTEITDSTKQNKVEATKPAENSTNSEVENEISTPDYLLEISNPDLSYSPSLVSLSAYDRAKLERLVMGEAGTMGYAGCALVAQSIRDAMNRSGTSSIDTIISEYKYYGSTAIEPNQDVKDAVSFIFDQNGSAVQHRILCFYIGTSKWHETQKFIISCGSVRFFDLTVA